MASIISSTNRSTASVIDTVGITAEVFTQLISTSARAVSMLDVKAKAMHQAVTENAIMDMATAQEDSIEERAADLTDRKEQRHRRMFPTQPFDRAATYQAMILKLVQALADAQK